MIAKPAHLSDEELPDAKEILAPQTYATQNGSNGTHHTGSVGVIARVLPHSLEAEEYLLSTVLLDGEPMLLKCIEAKIRPESFYDPKHGLIYAELVRMQKDGLPIDVGALAVELTERNLIEPAGGIAFLTQVTSRIPTTAQAAHWVRKVVELATLREIIRVNVVAIDDCYNFSGDLPTLTADLKRRLDFASDGPKKSLGTPYSVWQPSQFRAYEPPPNLNLLGSGYIRRRQLTTLIGPPGVGKSRLSLWLACCHISGREFMGLDCSNGPAKWLFFGNENDPLRQKTDLDFFYRQLLKAEQDRCDKYLYMHVMDKPDDGIITLADPEAYAKLLITLKAIVPEVVVFDPWGNMIEGNENDNEEVRKTLKLLLRAVSICCPEAAIIVIHHARTGKSTAAEAGNNFSGGSLGRGSKTLVSSARCELALWPGHSEDSSRLVLTCEKVNNVKKFDPKGLTFENGIYVQDHSFDLDAWRDDIAGIRSNAKTLTIEDLVEAVKSGIHKKNALVEYCEREFEVSRASVTRRLKDAVEKEWLSPTIPPGSYTLGPKSGAKQKPTRSRYPDQDD